MIKEICKSAFPYLVDIAITTKCRHNCWWCYASSLPEDKGEDAEDYFVGNTLRKALFDARVFEVVFGGGDPTLFHIDYKAKGYYATLPWLLEEYRRNGFKVSLTTRNYDWFKMDTFEGAVQSLHAIAISCESLDDLRRAKKLEDKIQQVPWNDDTHSAPVITVQKILGLYDMAQLKKFFTRCRELGFRNVTLLGFKNYGRAVLDDRDVEPHVSPQWIEVAAKSELNIGVDSAIVRKWGAELTKAGVPIWMQGGVEGKQTCFIDAVHKKIYPSSTCGEGVDFSKPPYGKESEAFLQAFERF